MFPMPDRHTRALRHAQTLLSDAPTQTGADAEEIKALLTTLSVNTVATSADQRIAVTEEGFVVMAVVPALRVQIGRVTTIPGFDHRGVRGWLVLGLSGRAFHSRAASAREAIAEAGAHLDRATRMEQHFGGKAQMIAAVARARLWQWSRFEDAAAAGLCQWGIESFLRRFGLWQLAHAAGGLPKAVLWMGGGYPRRVIAATLMRKQRGANVFVPPSPDG